MGTLSPCLKGNHKPKAPHLPKCAPPSPSQTTASATGRPFQTLSMLCSQGACLELGGGRGTAVRRRLVCKSPLSSSPPVYALNGWCVLQTVCQGERERWRGGALGTASPCYHAVTLLKDIFKLSSPPVPGWSPTATSPLISHCNLVSIYTWALG